MKKVVIIVDHLLVLIAIAMRVYVESGNISPVGFFAMIVGSIATMLSVAWFMLKD